MKKIIAMLAVVLLVSLAILPTTADTAKLEVHFLDVGQGDCAVVLFDGQSMIIDGGPRGSSQLVYSYVHDTRHLAHVDYVISTHPHLDHVGGLASVLNAAPVDLILTPVTEWNSKAFNSMLKYAELQGTPLVVPREGDTLQLGGALITILHYWPEAVQQGRTNDSTIVLRIDYGATSFLFTGDAEDWSEYMMIDAVANLKADVLKASHHGSGTASTGEFLQGVQPEYAVISIEKNNEYGHPHKNVLDRLNTIGATVLRTDQLGTIIIGSNGESIFSPEHI